MNEFPFFAYPVRQKRLSFYQANFPAAKIIELCVGLKAPASRVVQGETEEETAAQGAEFVNSISNSSFVQRVTEIQEEEHSSETPFQRFIDKARVRRIAAYLQEEDALMPNGIILATKENVEVWFSQDGPRVEIKLEWGEGQPLNIIDGQHRVEALRLLIKDGHTEFENFEVPIVVLVNQPFFVQAELFAVVNGKQKSVNRSQIYDLLGYLPIRDKKLRHKIYQGEMAIFRFAHHVVKVLNEFEGSPWQERVKMRGSGVGVVTQAAFVDALYSLIAPRKFSTRLKELPLLHAYFQEGDLPGLAKKCLIYFSGIKDAWPSYWNNPERFKSCLFGKTTGVAVAFQIMHDLLLAQNDNERWDVATIKRLWQLAPEDRIKRPPASGGKVLQTEWRNAILNNMLPAQVRERQVNRVEEQRTRLRLEGALY